MRSFYGRAILLAVHFAEFLYTVILRPKPLRIAANAILRKIIPSTIQYGPVTIALNPKDPVISGALTFRQYEPDETAFVAQVLSPSMTVLDVGANVGFYTAQFAHAVSPSGRVFAFEPDPECHSFLLKTIAVNSFSNVYPVQAAASSSNGSMSLFTSSENRGDNRLYSNDLADGSITVPVICLDDYLASQEVHQVNFIKIDVQGFEGEVIAGLQRTIAQSPSLTILMEFWPDGLRRAGSDAKTLLFLLSKWNLKLSHLGPNGSTAPIDDIDAFVAQYPGRRYTNIVASKHS